MPTQFLLTLQDPAQIPSLFKKQFFHGYAEPRIAFVGRSNVGKSSLINALTRQRIARVSSTPGKTRAIHFFLWKEPRRIVVDLPGYGFAKVAKKEQHEWRNLIQAYLKADNGLAHILILWDSRIGPTPHDEDAYDFFVSLGITPIILMTKFDQLKTQSARSKRKQEVTKWMKDRGLENPHWITTHDLKTIDLVRESLYQDL